MGCWCGEWSVPPRSTPVCPCAMPPKGGGLYRSHAAPLTPLPFCIAPEEAAAGRGRGLESHAEGTRPISTTPDQRGICSRSALHLTSPWMSVVMSQRRRKTPQFVPRCRSRERLGGGGGCVWARAAVLRWCSALVCFS